MTIWFDADGNNGGHVALYTGNDDAPMSNPAAYIGTRTKLSTKFAYLPFPPALKISVNVPMVGNIGYTPRSDMRRTIVLGNHGQSGIPFLKGYVIVNGVIRSLEGTVPVHTSLNGSGVIHWTLGVNATQVFLSEGRSYYNFAGVPSTLPCVVYVSDKVI
jgi:hypothetical protein